jgi:hypothetical protein
VGSRKTTTRGIGSVAVGVIKIQVAQRNTVSTSDIKAMNRPVFDVKV